MRDFKLFLQVVIVLSVFFACNENPKSGSIDSSKNIGTNPDSLLLDSLTNLIQSNPYRSEYYNQRSIVYESMGKLTASLNDLDKALQLDTLNVDYMVRLSDKYLQFGQSQKTRELLLKAEQIEDQSVEVLYRLGNLYFYVQDYKTAASYLRRAKDADPFHAPTYFTFGMIYKERRDTLKAIEQFQIAVEREPKYYDAYMMLGALYSGFGDSLAIDYFNNALEVLPASYEAMYSKAFFYQQNEQPEKAIKQYNQMLDGNRDKYQYVFFNLGYIEMIFYNEFEKAISYFDSALTIQPDYAAAYTNKGFCFENLYKIDSAKGNYIKALELQPDLEVAKLGLKRLKN